MHRYSYMNRANTFSCTVLGGRPFPFADSVLMVCQPRNVAYNSRSALEIYIHLSLITMPTDHGPTTHWPVHDRTPVDVRFVQPAWPVKRYVDHTRQLPKPRTHQEPRFTDQIYVEQEYVYTIFWYDGNSDKKKTIPLCNTRINNLWSALPGICL